MARSRNRSDHKQPTLTELPRSRNTRATQPFKATHMDSWPVCRVCGLWKMLPRRGLPRHLFCIGERKAKIEKPQLARAA